ncbi:hypothetical protein [Streptomyces hilarionis]|uniref:hypothetical protein n=1 Tax=Streptomyces hilarionis TaxID=2839954 RepID=UPI002119F8FF|nr:hypothetical protein [Streptomyces hilarionis]MCQ9134131.1 hypothetical protein [Streptomyces hilarionis]
MTNPELDAALAHVPEIERTEKLLADAKKRLRDHPAGVAPDVARNNVIDVAVRAFQADGVWPANIGKEAAKVHAEACVWEAERLARSRAKDSTELLAYDTREAYSVDALAYLGTRLEEVLSDARTAAEILGEVRSADDAIKAGGDVVAAWGRLQGLVVDLTNIRAAQWGLLLPRLRPGDAVGGFNEERRKVRTWRSEGYGEVRGSLDGVPAFVRQATSSGQYSESALLWLARAGTAHVPTSFEDLQNDALAGDLVDVMAGADGPVRDYTPTVTPAPAPVPSRIPPHSKTPNLDESRPRPAPPKPTTVARDREATTLEHFED